jgi:AAA ATPase domain
MPRWQPAQRKAFGMRLPFRSLKIRGFRSISDTGLVLDGISNLNFLCGQNNAGKSNILTFILLLCNHLSKNKNYQFKPTDYHQSGEGRISFSLFPDLELISNSEKIPATIGEFFTEWLSGSDGSVPWFNYAVDGHGITSLNIASVLSTASWLPDQRWQAFFHRLTGAQGGDKISWIHEVFKRVHPLAFLKTYEDMVPALRTLTEIRREGLSVRENRVEYAGRPYYGGMGTIELLFNNQHPPVGQEKLLDDFRKVQRFLRYITGNDNAEIEIPFDKSALIVNMDGKRLPISNLGSGIEELVVISTAAVNFHNQVVCIEEPELHIHPLLQRKLVEFLQKETDNTYFIATHSPHILDASSASVYHVQLVNRASAAAYCDTGSQRFQICHDLGYQASDLLQANSIIWVEGPSDRIYLTSWLRCVASDLIEGLDFSVMFYGGKLLSHLTADDQLVDDFINLNRLNRNVAVLIDSDKDNEGASVNETKRRIGSELRDNGGFEWTTQGREIENYLEKTIYLKAMEHLSVMPNADYESPFGDRCVGSYNGQPRSVNKLKLAKLATSIDPKPDVLDLSERLNELVAFIRKASRKNI